MIWLLRSPQSTARAFRSVMAFTLAFGAMALAMSMMLSEAGPGALSTNVMLPAARRALLGITAVAIVGAALVALTTIARERTVGIEAVDWWARALAPTLVLPFVVPLTSRTFGTEVEVALVLGVVVLVFERLARVSLQAWHERPERQTRLRALGSRLYEGFFSNERRVVGAVIVLSIAQGVLMSVWAVWSHQRFHTYGYDLGQYAQLFETTLRGRFLAAPAMGQPELWGDLHCSHSDFVIFALLPFYALHPTAETTLVLQAGLVALGGIPTYLFARQWVRSSWAFLIALAWLAYPPMHGGQLYDFHTQPIGAAFAIWAVWALGARRFVLYWVFVVLALSAREDTSMALAMLGVFLMVSGRMLRTGVATAVVSGVYFVIVRFFVLTNHQHAGSYNDIAAIGENGFGAVLMTLLTNPGYALKTLLTMDRVKYVFQIFLPLAFLPLRRLVFWVLLIAPFMLTLLTNSASPMNQMSFQYVFNWVPYIFPVAAIGLSLLAAEGPGLVRARAALAALVLGTVMANLQWGAFSPALMVQGGFVAVPLKPPTQSDKDRAVAVQNLLSKVPADAVLCTSDRLQPQTISHLENWSLKAGVHHCTYLLWSDLGDNGSEHAMREVGKGVFEIIATERDVHLAKKRETP